MGVGYLILFNGALIVGNQDKTAAPSLDRIDPNFGYIKGNVAVISWQANKYKSNMSKEIIEKLYKYVFETF